MLSVKHPILAATVVAAVSTATLFAQGSSSVSPSEGLELLTRVAKKYADAKSYYIESIEERTSVAEFNHSWQKTVFVACEAPGEIGRAHV